MEDVSMEDVGHGPDPDAGAVADDGALGDMDLGHTGLTDDPDLFGEAGDGLGNGIAGGLGHDFGIPVPLTSAPLPASVIFRVEEMQRTGCCSKLAWSNTGYVAQVSKDGSTVTFRTVIRNQETAEWELSEPSKHPIKAPEGRRFEHVRFNGMGPELAVFDQVGHVHLYSLMGALGHLQPAVVDPSTTEASASELDAVVDLHWLPMYPIEFRVPYIGPAVRQGPKWVTQTRNPDQNSAKVHHPNEGRNALLYVSRTSKLHLRYQNENGVWLAVSAELETWHTSQQLLTHAAMGEDGDHLVLVTHDFSRRFRVYRINIHWNAAQQTRQNHHFVTVAPALEIGRSTILDNIAPQHASLTKLSMLRILSKIPRFVTPESSQQSSTDILAVFTHASAPTATGQPYQEPFSVVTRWKLESSTPTLHESFTKLKLNGPTPVLPAVTRLRRQQDVLTNKLVLMVEPQSHNTMVLLGCSDGTTELRERLSWTVAESFGDTVTASNIPQSGLDFLTEPQSPHTAHLVTNADASFMAYTKQDGTLGTKHVSSRYGWQAIEHMGNAAGLIETIVVCLARQYAILTSLSSTSDEILAILPPDLAPELKVLFVKQVLRIMCRYFDVSMLDQQKQQRGVMQELMHVRAISAQLVLGIDNKTPQRGFAAQLAYAYLNLRHVNIAFAQVFTRNNDANRSPDLIPSLTGLVHFASDIMVYVLDSLLQVKRSMREGQTAKEAFMKHVSETGSPAVHLLLCSFPRVFLRMQTLFVTQYMKWVHQRFKTGASSVEHRLKLEAMNKMVQNLPFTYSVFAELVQDFDAAIRSAYSQTGADAEQRMEIELAMWTEGVVPDGLAPALQTLVDTILPKICEHVDGGKLHFWDTAWLGIKGGKNALKIDAIRKIPLTSGMKLRLCRRCGAEMEDIPYEVLRQAPDWLRHNSRHCFCQDYWWAVG